MTRWRGLGLNPDKPFPIAGSFDKPVMLDELGLVIGLAAAGLYVILFFVTRVRRDTAGYGEAVNSNFAMGAGRDDRPWALRHYWPI